MYFTFDAANHVLYSIVAKVSISLFGDSEFALRLPSVAAGFFLMLGVGRILEHVESRPARWLAFAAIGLHPLLLDFSVAARGYGMSLAFLAWAISASMNERPSLAALLLGFAVSANFTAAFAAVGLIAATFLLSEGSWKRRLGSMVGMSLLAALPVLATCAGILPLLSGERFYAGYPALSDSVLNLIGTSIYMARRAGLFGTFAAAQFIEFGFLHAVGLFLAISALLAWRRGARQDLIPVLTLALAGIAVLVAHYLKGMYYPVDRTGLWLVLLFSLAWALAAGNMKNRLPLAVNLALAAAFAIQFATQFETDYFAVWRYDRSMKEIAHRMENEIRGKPPGSISIGANWIHQPSLEYYRVHDKVAALRPAERNENGRR